ncbi:MAG: GAF domain-containing SpoIIE family protein phosphatase [Chloroflexota bacterium]|nr:GAF domain-containing SpoIIE family protein phosphatase [Chloroflexota bacterium]
MKLSQYLDPGWLSAIARRVTAQTDRAVQILDVDGRPLCVLGEPAPSAVEKPIIVSGQPTGAVRVDGSDGPALALADLLANLVSARASAEVELANLSDELLTKYEEINLLYDIGTALSPLLDESTISRIALDRALQVIGAKRGTVLVTNPQTSTWCVSAEQTDSGGHIVANPDRPGPLLSSVLDTGQPLLVERLEDYPNLSPAEQDHCGEDSFLAVPIAPPGGGNALLGVILLLGKQHAGVFTASDQKLLTTIAGQVATAIQNRRLVAELQATQRLKHDMEIAHRIQTGLLPEHPPIIPGVDLAGLCIPAASIGGDYYDFFTVGDQVDLVLADVSGHSIGAALVMAATRSVLRAQAMDGHAPAEILAHTNQVMSDDMARASLFITGFYARYDPAAWALCYANAGHNLPILYRADSARIELLDADGIILGVLPNVSFEEKQTSISSGDVLVMYTDGITEGQNLDGEQFGEERLYRIITEMADCPAQAIADGVLSATRVHGRGVDQYDDISLIVMKVTA